MLKCICGKISTNNKSDLSHKARCNIFLDAKSKYLETLKDDIILLYQTVSVLAIISKLNPSEYVSYSSIAKKLKDWGIKTRTPSQAKKLESSRQQTAETNMIRYGGTGNPLSNGSILKEKRDATIKHKYGVTNIFGSDWFRNTITENEAFWIERHGITRVEVAKIAGKAVWDNYSDKSRKTRCDNSLKSAQINCVTNRGVTLNEYRSIINQAAWDKLTPEERSERTKNYVISGGSISKLETRVLDILETAYPINRQKWCRDGDHARSYDAHIINTNILIEINGDYWHGNPNLYSSGDIISYPGGKRLVDEIWAKDARKKELAELYGYRIITIWENAIRQTDDIMQLLHNEIGEV